MLVHEKPLGHSGFCALSRSSGTHPGVGAEVLRQGCSHGRRTSRPTPRCARRHRTGRRTRRRPGTAHTAHLPLLQDSLSGTHCLISALSGPSGNLSARRARRARISSAARAGAELLARADRLEAGAARQGIAPSPGTGCRARARDGDVAVAGVGVAGVARRAVDVVLQPSACLQILP